MSKNDNTALARIGDDAAARIDEITSQALEYARVPTSFAAAIHIAQSIGALKKALTDEMMQPIMELQNWTMGFLTDRNEGYDVRTVKAAFIEMQLRGLRPVGNEWNLLGGRPYVAQNGARRLVYSWPGLSDFTFYIEIPALAGDGSAKSKCGAAWKVDGKPDHLDVELSARVNKGMGADGVIGKLKRKLYCAVLEKLSGLATPDGEAGDAIDVAPVTTAPPKSVIIKGTRKEEMREQMAADVLAQFGDPPITFKQWENRLWAQTGQAEELKKSADLIAAAVARGAITEAERKSLAVVYAKCMKGEQRPAEEGQEIT